MSQLVAPVSATLSAWLGACLRGEVPPDAVLDAMRTDDVLHRVTGLAPDPVSWSLAIGELRGRGGRTAALALPVAGDFAGLAGPPDFNHAALDAGQAVLVPGSGLGLVPEETVDAITWHALPAERPRPVDPVEAGQALRRALAETSDHLERLDVARWLPDLADFWAEVSGHPHLDVQREASLELPASYPAPLRAVADQAVTCLRIVDLALHPGPGAASGALTAHEAERRTGALAPLARAARQALVAACSG